MYRYKFKLSAALLLISGLITALFNSCKKDDTTSLKNYLCNYSSGQWVLASLTRTDFKHNTTTVNIDSTEDLAFTCGTQDQMFTFAFTGTCSYTNFQCNNTAGTAGKWSLNADSLRLHVTLQLPDSTRASGKSYPFASCQLVTLGANSLVFYAGDINSYYTDTQQHHLYRYSFIHPSSN